MAGFLGHLGTAIAEGVAAGAAHAGVHHMLTHENQPSELTDMNDPGLLGYPQGQNPGPSYIPSIPDFPDCHGHIDTGPTIIDQNTIFDVPAHDGIGGMSTTPGLYGGMPPMGGDSGSLLW